MDAPSEARTRSGSHHLAEGSDSYQAHLFWPCSFPAPKPLLSLCHYYIKLKDRGTALPDLPQASRQRALLAKLGEQYLHLLQGLLSSRRLLKGSVYALKTRCGKPSCHCAAPQGPLHSAHVLSWSHAGKTHLRSLSASDLARWRQLTETYRRFRQARARLVKLHQQILLVLDRLEQAMRLPPPPPASRKRKT